MLKLAQTNQQTNQPTDQQTGQKQYVPHYYKMERQRPTRLVMGPCKVEIDRIVIRDVQYKFEVIQCTNKEVNFQGSSAKSVGGAGGQDGQTDRRTSIQYPHFFSEKRGDN
ncbi:hypothetical protein DPMN_000915 [Dreissena polymorpha]|uniref:Uncharacterized protein n=1 Tax=Dreissena polymorpha TaxID=45954 RepID=A0A9D4MJY6_DREPO|nr:hypothetical protein DPMN_000915 [Dreissena polymorpha]